MIPHQTAIWAGIQGSLAAWAIMAAFVFAAAVCTALAAGSRGVKLPRLAAAFNGLTDNVSACLIIVDADGLYVFVNRAAERMLGTNGKAAVGRHVREVEHDVRTPLLLAMDLLSHGKRPVSTGRFQVGERMLVSEFSRLEDRRGRYAGLIALSRDMTEECEFCGHMVRTERMAVLGELAAAMAHEINSPLGGVMESVRIIEKNEGNWQKISRFLPLVKRGLDQIATTVRQMLKFASPQEAPRMPMVLDDMVSQCVDFVGYRQEETGARLVLDLASDRTVVNVSASVTQVLINLINNAFDAVAGRPEANVTVKTELVSAAAEVMVRVIDNGPGIPAHLRARIFEPFFTTKASGRGTGLGLSISARIAAKNGGRILVGDAPGGGAVMTLILPVASGAGKGKEWQNQAKASQPGYWSSKMTT